MKETAKLQRRLNNIQDRMNQIEHAYELKRQFHFHDLEYQTLSIQRDRILFSINQEQYWIILNKRTGLWQVTEKEQ